jgi:REP element-mobilizing transposase RayT
MRARLYYHLVWTTRFRAALIDEAIGAFLGRYLPAVARQERARLLELGIVRTHVHVLFQADSVTVLPRLIQRFKGGSSALAHKEGHAHDASFGWTKGYSLETVSPGTLPAVRAYVRDQAARHPGQAIPGWPTWEETPPPPPPLTD